jgi:hypothetical protein
MLYSQIVIKVEITPDIREIIDKTILQYPCIDSLIKKNGKFYVFSRSRYGKVSSEEEKYIPEFTLAGVIFGAYRESISRKFIDYLEIPPRQFTNQLKNLDVWLGRYKKYRNTKFRDKLINNFFNSYSEIEFYDRLISKQLTPEIDVKVGSGNNNLDFMVNLNSHCIFIELTTRFESLETERNMEVGNLEKAKRIVIGIIQRKICEQFRDISDENCIILAINIDYCPLDIPLKMEKDLLNFCPKNIYGVLLYRERRGEFYENPRYSLTNEEIVFFQNLFDQPTFFERVLELGRSEKKYED